MDKTESGKHGERLRRAMNALEKMQARLRAYERAKTESVAVIGMACRFPGGADTPERFWQMLCEGVNAICEVPNDRWDIDACYDPDMEAAGKIYTRSGGFIDHVDQFDPLFFGITPREAIMMDPQQRLVLETAWEALERANIVPSALRGRQTGVFIGMMGQDYVELVGRPQVMDVHTSSGIGPGMASGRLSYMLGSHGPSLTVDTQCSSSLVAVHLACNSLRNNESSLALAGGVNLILSPITTMMECRTLIISPEGCCKTFDAYANGICRGEGCGMIVLKRLSDAQDDGDPILAVIRGTAVNHNGQGSGLSVPNEAAQETLIRQALANAETMPHQVRYIEAHGTGTSLGDPIEVNALGSVFGECRHPIYLGSVKTNIGHTEGAAGIAGVIKAVLALNHGEIPPNLHFNTPSPHIPWDDLPFRVPTARTPFPEGGRTAGVSSFGMSGTNAHIILAEPSPKIKNQKSEIGHRASLLPLSARNEQALHEMAGRYAQYFSDNPDLNFADVCHTAATCRSRFEHRLGIVASSVPDAKKQLALINSDIRSDSCIYGKASGKTPRVAFLFTGQGSQYSGMGYSLYKTSSLFRDIFDQCNDLLRPYLENSLSDVLFPPDQNNDIDNALIHQTAYTQPALFAFEYALAKLWISWGVRPVAMLGHSIGEYVAACLAGVFSLEDALKLVAARGRLMQALPRDGCMVSIQATVKEVSEAVQPSADKVSVAALNGPLSVVISGDAETVQSVVSYFEGKGVRTKLLKTSYAFHSPLTEPMLSDFYQIAKEITYNTPETLLMANVSGEPAGAELAQPDYWVRHAREPVQFAKGMETLRQENIDTFIEIGPAPVLIGMGHTCLPPEEADSMHWLPSLNPGADTWQTLLTGLADLYVRGEDNIGRNHPEDWEHTRRLRLPTYPFQRQRYWVPDAISPVYEQHTRCQAISPLLDKMISSPILDKIIFQGQLSPDRLPYLRDHRIYQEIVVPGATWLSMLLSAATHCYKSHSCILEDIIFPRAMVLAEEEERIVQIMAEPVKDLHEEPGARPSQASFRVVSFAEQGNGIFDETEISEHALGLFMPLHESSDKTGKIGAERVSFDELRHRCTEEISGNVVYQLLDDLHIHIGHAHRCIKNILRSDKELLVHLRLPGTIPDTHAYQVHPTLIDACLQSCIITVDSMDKTHIPFRIRRITFYRQTADNELQCHIRQVGEWNWDIRLCDTDGLPVLDITGYEAREAPKAALIENQKSESWLYCRNWYPAAVVSRERIAESGTWIIFADKDGIGTALSELLHQQGQQCLLAEHGDWPEQDGRCIKNIRGDKSPPYRVVYLQSVEQIPDSEMIPDAVPNLAQKYCTRVLALVQELAGSDHPARLWLVTRGAQAVADEPDGLSMHQSPLWGMGNVIASEHPDLGCTCIDLSPDASPDESAKSLLSELLSDDDERQIAFRAQGRFAARLARYRFGTPVYENVPVRDNASFLITGGLGGLGLQIARYLAKQGARYLVLNSRSGNAEHEVQKTTVAELEDAGVTVRTVSADVSQRDDVQRLLEVCESLAPIGGIIHAAGVLDDGILLKQSAERFERVMAPKVHGAWHLHTLASHTQLDFFVCFSSATSLFGTPGQSNYAAANAFLDALAHHRRSQGMAGITVNWSYWHGAGMATELVQKNQQEIENRGEAVIPPDIGIRVFGSLLQHNPIQVVVAPIFWNIFLKHAPAWLRKFADRMRPHTDEPADNALKPGHSFISQLHNISAEEAWNSLQSAVEQTVAETIKLEESLLDPDKGLFDLGLDSLLALEVRRKLQEIVETTLPSTLVFDYPSVNDIVHYIGQNVLEINDKKANSEDDELDHIPEDEMEAMLLQEIKNIEENTDS